MVTKNSLTDRQTYETINFAENWVGIANWGMGPANRLTSFEDRLSDNFTWPFARIRSL